jgi:hypothetical protein
MDDTSFTLRHNAKRAAERMIRAGAAPSIDYGLRTREDGRIEIVWRTGDRPSMHCAEAEAAPTAIETELAAEMLDKAEAEGWSGPDPDGEEAEREDEVDKAIAREAIAEIEEHPERLISGPAFEDRLSAMHEPGAPAAEPQPDPWPPGTRVSVAIGKRKSQTGTVSHRIGKRSWRVALDGAAAGVTNLYRGEQLSATDAMPEPTPEKKKRRGPTPSNRPSKSAELDAAAAAGIMPEKPIMTSKANPGYQKRFDHLAERAAKGDWESVRNYEVKGINSYAKMVKQYRERLLAAHAAAEAMTNA